MDLITEQMHPAQYTPSIIGVFERIFGIFVPKMVFDPFAGTGLRLGALCDKWEVPFAGCDIEDWAGKNERITVADATQPYSYPAGEFTVITSPTYGNGINDHFKPTDSSKRFTYRVALGHELHKRNSGRYGIRGGKKAWSNYWRINHEAIRCWRNHRVNVIVNVKAFIHGGKTIDLPELWVDELDEQGYNIQDVIEVPTPGIRFGSNHDARIDHEVIILATSNC